MNVNVPNGFILSTTILHVSEEAVIGVAGLAALACALKCRMASNPNKSKPASFTDENITSHFVAAIPAITPKLNLEVAISTQTEIFTQTSNKRVLWGFVNLGDNMVQIRMPVTYRYHICLRDAWQISVSGSQISVVSPILRASLPPAIHTDQIERLSVRGWGRGSPRDLLEQLERQLTPALSENASNPKQLDLVRHACRQSVAELVRLWLEREGQWQPDGFTTIRVRFADEISLPLEPTLRLLE